MSVGCFYSSMIYVVFTKIRKAKSKKANLFAFFAEAQYLRRSQRYEIFISARDRYLAFDDYLRFRCGIHLIYGNYIPFYTESSWRMY